MALLRLANSETTKLFLDDEKTSYIEVRAEISKRERNLLIGRMPTRTDIQDTGLTPTEGIAFQTDLFETLVTGWSLDAEVTADNYLALAPEAADAVDALLAKQFTSLMPTPDEEGKA